MARQDRNDNSKGRNPKKKSSGWVKPDGTPLRKRKGDYFPDKEIAKRTPSHRFDASKKTREDRPVRGKDDRGERPFRRDNDSPTQREGGPFKKSFENKDSDKPSRESGTFKTYRDNRDKDSRYPSKSRGNDSRRGKEFGDNEKTGISRPFKREEGEDKDRSRKVKDASSADRDKPSFKRGDRESGPPRDDRSRAPRKEFSSRDSDRNKPSGRFEKKDFKKHGDKPLRSKSGPHRERKPFDPDAKPGQEKPVRLNKYIANAGMCSRREADDLITAGVISINGEIVSELGTKVYPGDVVKFHDQTLKTEKMVYVLLNKPKDYITTTDDPEERRTVMSLVHNAGKERIFPVGRLDRNTTGLLLITNDGELTKRLTHPSGNIKKIYQVELDRNLTQEDMLRAAAGVELEDGVQSVDEIHYESPDDKSVIGVELHSGKNRIVRRIFEAMDYKVKKLDRVYFAGLTKKDLPRGRWRFLTEMEVSMLKMLTGKKR